MKRAANPFAMSSRLIKKYRTKIYPADGAVLSATCRLSAQSPFSVMNVSGKLLKNKKAISTSPVFKGKSGEENNLSKLKDKEVEEIRALYAKGGISQRELARRYNVRQAAICYRLKNK